MMHTGNGPVIPGMVPSWPPTMGMGTRPPFVSPNPGDQVTINSTVTNNVETIASSTTSESQSGRTNVASTSAGATSEGEGQDTQQTTEASQTPDASSSSEDPSLTSRTTGVRRRLAASLRPEERAGGQTVNTTQTRTIQSASVTPRQSDSPVYILFVGLLVLAILLLVLRRLYIMKMLPVLF